MANGGTHIGPGTRYSNKFEDSDSGTGSSNEAHVIRHIDRNILACQICQQRYKEPKVSKVMVVLIVKRHLHVIFGEK